MKSVPRLQPPHSFFSSPICRTTLKRVQGGIGIGLRLFAFAACWLVAPRPIAAQTGSSGAYDVVIYGGSSAGVTAAVQAARMGKSTLLISAQSHIGGMTASGLGTTDVGNAATIGGVALAFYANVYRYYHPATADTLRPPSVADTLIVPTGPEIGAGVQFYFEPHVAEAVFTAMLAHVGANVVLGEELDRVNGVGRSGDRITFVRTKTGRVYYAKMFIDATYEGDLLAAAGVPYRIGRESRAQYGEWLAGVYLDQELVAEVDPYRVPGNPASGLLPGVSPDPVGPDGTGDRRVQQYNLRLCLTNAPSNRIPIPQPASYDRSDYELLARRLRANPNLSIADVIKIQSLPGGKADINANESFSTDMAGDESTRWAEAGDAERATILQRYRDYTQGLLWFLAHDPAVPIAIRQQAAQWGFAADEFTDTDHLPWQLYVREARRMIGQYVMTQRDCDGITVASDSVALGSYAIDSHKVTLFVDNAGQLNTEGFIFHGVQPYPISYRALVPPATICSNLLVPVCVSATHVAYNSLRMEPVYMMLGQSAATAACLAIDSNSSVQNVDYPTLAKQLEADGQILSWPSSTAALEADVFEQPEQPTAVPPSIRQRIIER